MIVAAKPDRNNLDRLVTRLFVHPAVEPQNQLHTDQMAELYFFLSPYLKHQSGARSLSTATQPQLIGPNTGARFFC